MRHGAPTAAIVLGAAVRADGTASATLRLRVGHAVELYRAGKVDILILTGAAVRHGPAESHVARDLARAAGIPDRALRVETQSRNTVENLARAKALVTPGARVVIVSNRWHLPRARLIARLMGLRARGSAPRGALGPIATTAAILREVAATPRSALRTLRLRR
jgi:uncharacterized SAM-binding protein YcdF (DUF218 family)